MPNGVYIYIEHISNKHKRKTTATFYNEGGLTSNDAVLRKLKNNNKNDVNNAEIITGRGGGNPTNTSQTESRGTAANSVDMLDSVISPDSAGKSSYASGGAEAAVKAGE
jgi:hypothetical protein